MEAMISTYLTIVLLVIEETTENDCEGTIS